MLGLMLAYGLDLATYIYIAGLLISVALVLTKKKPQLASLDDIFSSTATQGAFLPLVIGRQRVPTIVLWVEDAGVAGVTGFARGTSGSQFAKGGGSTPPNPSYLERALHGLCVGPATELRTIYQNNEILWQGSLTPTTTPSGTSISVREPDGTFSSFKIFWGFPDDPVIPYLEASSTHGIPTNYSHSLKVLWDVKRLGTTRQWPRLEYDVVCPCYSNIASTPPETPRTGSDLRPTWKEWIARQTDGGYRPLSGNSVPGPFISEDAKVDCCLWQIDASKRTLILFDPRAQGLQSAGSYYQMSYATTPDEDWAMVYPDGGIVKIWVTQTTQGIQSLYSGLAATLGANMLSQGFSDNPPSAMGLVANQWNLFRIASSKLKNHPNSAGAPHIGASPTFPTVTINTLEITLGERIDESTIVDLDLTPPDNNLIGQLITFPSTTTQVAFGLGIVEPVDTLDTDGINPIHIVDQLLFARYPYGAGRDRSRFNNHSIEVASQTLQNENIRGGIAITDGEGLESVLGKIFQDIGLAIPYDPLTGLYTFRLLRYEETATNIPREMLLEEISVENVPGDRPSDVLAFTFNDRNRNYREVPIRVQDNGQIVETETQKPTKVPVFITCDRDSVARMAPRRAQEALGSVTSFTLPLNYKGALAVAGSRFRCSSYEDPNVQFIVGTVKRDLNSNRVEVVAVLDAYDPPDQNAGESVASVGYLEQPPVPQSKKLVDPLADFIAIEVPRGLSSDRRKVEVLFAASRTSSATIGGQVWISADGLSFVEIADAVLVAQGVLETPLYAAGASYDMDLHEFSCSHDVDISSVEDLTLYSDQWRAGRQVLLIGDEVIFLMNAYLDDPLDGYLQGLIRGRAGTLQQDHAAGAKFYILYAHQVERTTSPAFLPNKTIHYKVGAQEIRRNQPIIEVDDKEIELQGLSMKPIRPSALRLAGFSTSYDADEATIRVCWAYHSVEFPRTGLGNQSAGDASGLSKPAGHFIVKIYTAGPTLVHETTTEEAYFDLSDAFRDAMGLDSGATWTIKVSHVEGSFTSAEAELSLWAV